MPRIVLNIDDTLAAEIDALGLDAVIDRMQAEIDQGVTAGS